MGLGKIKESSLTLDGGIDNNSEIFQLLGMKPN